MVLQCQLLNNFLVFWEVWPLHLLECTSVCFKIMPRCRWPYGSNCVLASHERYVLYVPTIWRAMIEAPCSGATSGQKRKHETVLDFGLAFRNHTTIAGWWMAKVVRVPPTSRDSWLVARRASGATRADERPSSRPISKSGDYFLESWACARGRLHHWCQNLLESSSSRLLRVKLRFHPAVSLHVKFLLERKTNRIVGALLSYARQRGTAHRSRMDDEDDSSLRTIRARWTRWCRPRHRHCGKRPPLRCFCFCRRMENYARLYAKTSIWADTIPPFSTNRNKILFNLFYSITAQQPDRKECEYLKQ